MNNPIYIAENSKDMFQIDIPKTNTETETTVESQPPMFNNWGSELQYFLKKSTVSFGIVLVIFLVACLIIGLAKGEKKDVTFSAINNDPSIKKDEKQERPATQQPQSQNVYRRSTRKRGSLYSPTNINDAIKKFLERTKEH